MTQQSIEDLKKYISKLKVVGISLDVVGMEIEDGYPELKSIFTTSQDTSALPINISQLNNGSIILPIEILDFDIKLDDIDYSIQTIDFIREMLKLPNVTKMLSQDKLQSKTIQSIELRIKSLLTLDYSPEPFPRKALAFYDRLEIGIHWLTYKFRHITSTKIPNADVYTDTYILFKIQENFGNLNMYLTSESLKGVIAKEVTKILNESLQLLSQAIGNSDDIFTGEIRVRKDNMIIAVITPSEKELLDKLKTEQPNKLKQVIKGKKWDLYNKWKSQVKVKEE
jgi:hypothetical protein